MMTVRTPHATTEAITVDRLRVQPGFPIYDFLRPLQGNSIRIFGTPGELFALFVHLRLGGGVLHPPTMRCTISEEFSIAFIREGVYFGLSITDHRRSSYILVRRQPGWSVGDV